MAAGAEPAHACLIETEGAMRDVLPRPAHESIVCGLTRQPDSVDVLNDACGEVQELLVTGYGWPNNVMVHGFLYQVLWDVYRAGERRGVARGEFPAAGLFPVPDLPVDET